MANIKINDLTLAGNVADNMQYETDITGSVANKVTSSQIKDYVNAGKTGGKTVTGGLAASESLTFSTTSDVTKGTYIFEDLTTANGILRTDGGGVVTSSIDLPDGTTATTQAPLDNTTKLATTAYVDAAIVVENIWDRTGTTITVKNAGDDIDFSTAGLAQSLECDSTNIAQYDSHPTFTIDEQIIDKKYVDDQIANAVGIKHENLTIASPGQTAFTLTTTPVNADQSILTLNGQTKKYGASDDFTISGTTLTWNDPDSLTLETTDDLQIWYDITIAPPSVIPAFRVKNSILLSNVTGDSTVYKIAFDSKEFDRDNNYNTTTYEFTAPKDGLYWFNLRLNLAGVTGSHTNAEAIFQTSLGNVFAFKLDPGNVAANTGVLTLTGGAFIELSSGNTVFCSISVYNGSKVIDLNANFTNFEGYFVSD